MDRISYLKYLEMRPSLVAGTLRKEYRELCNRFYFFGSNF